MKRTVINGTPLQNSINESDEYLTTAKSDLLPRANIIPIGKQKIREKNDTINVKDRPPQAPVSTHSNPNSPPDIK
jgi:hypothetical protein